MKNKNLIFEDWGIIDYNEAYKKQVEYLNKKIQQKQNSQLVENTIIFAQHPHVFTLGKHGSESNLLISEQKLKSINAKFVKTDRGGDITYHGFGQLVVYPIIDLDNFDLHVKRFVFTLEEAVIRTLQQIGIKTHRLKGAPGVWVTKNNRSNKICAIGIKVVKNITMHGIALNVNTDLSYFNFINPCGFTDKGATSIQQEKNENFDIDKIKATLKEKLIYCLNSKEILHQSI